MYNNLFASSYRFYNKFKGETPLGTSVIVVFVCQMTLFFLIITIVKKLTGINVASVFPNKFYFIPIFLLWMYLLYKHYSKEKVKAILQEFEQKSSREKKMWGIVTLISFIVPLVLIAFLLKK